MTPLKNVTRGRNVMLTLVAKWTRTRDPLKDKPIRVTWADGRLATQQDYINHREDTRELVATSTGVELRMYPDLVADVRYDYYTGVWFVVAPGEEPISLGLLYNATDEQIRAELSQFPRIYRPKIHR
jgi:hypothetical protein